MIRALFICLIAILVSIPSPAAEYSVGYVSGDYTFGQDGYWYKDSYQYTRSYNPGTAGHFYWSNGCQYYSPGTAGYYSYSRYYPPTPKAIDYSADDAEKQIIAFAQSAMLQEATIAKQKIRQEYHLQLADALGVKRPNGVFPYSANYAGLYGNGGYAIGGSYVTPSNTVYGNSYSLKQTVQTNDPNFDINAALQITGQAVSGVNQSLDKAGGILGRNVELAIEKQAAAKEQLQAYEAKVKLIEANALAFQAQMAALREPKTTVTTTTNSTGTAVKPNPQVLPQQQMPKIVEGWQDQLGAIAQTKCAGCHSGKNLQGGFDVQELLKKYESDPGYALKVFDRVRPDAPPAKRMPKKMDGSVGDPLTPREAALFLPH